ncbi:hypothetical protein V8C35DRAFT_302866 [Trichoderma chlorosporum]
MCHCSNSDDVDLAALRFSLCLPCENGIFENGDNEGQQVPWLVSPDSQDVKSSTVDSSSGLFGMYARAWTRLEMAIYGQDVDDSQDVGFCYGDAIAFAVCLPCYGCTIGSLQYAVRSYFNLQGTRRQDYSDGCCFPRATILRNEQEIILRERLRRAQEGKQQKPYGCYDQMLYSSKTEQPAVRGEQAQAQAVSNDNKAANNNIAAKASPAKVHSVHEDVHLPHKAPRRAPHGLEDDVATPAKANRQEHILHDDVESATPAKTVPHELGATSVRNGPL